MGIAILTSSNASWPWSNTGGQTTVTAELLGAGGGGGGVSNNTEEAGGGGKGGAYVRVTLTKGAESTLNITVGALGAAGNAAGGNGGDGGFSEINQNGTVVARAPGGQGGVGGTTNAGHAGGSTENGTEVHTGGTYFAGGNGATGDITANFSGGGGGAAGPTSAGTAATTQTGGARGTGTWADGSTTRNTAGADGRTTGNAGQTPADFGGGGSGGYATSATNRAGGAGAAGIVVLTWVDLTPSWRDLGELLSHRTVAPPRLETRTYDWSSAFISYQTTNPAPAGTGDTTGGLPSCLPFMQRRVIERTREPQPVYKLAVDQNISKWMPAAAALLACAIPTSAAAKQPDPRYASQPAAAIFPLGATPPTSAQIQPAINQTGLSARTPSGPVLDIRAYDWTQKVVPVSIVIDPTVAKWAPAFSSELASFRTAPAPSLDVRRYDWDTPESDWLKAILTPPPSVAQTSPAWTDDGQRTAARPSLDVRQYEWASAFSTPQAAPSSSGGSNQTASPGSVGWFVRRVMERTTGPQPVYTATLPAATPPTVAQTAPAWAFDGDRTADRARLDVRTYDWSVWVRGIAAPPATVGQTVPTWAFDGDRTSDRARLDVRAYDWLVDESSWIKATLSTAPTVAQTSPAWTSETQSFRTPAAKPLDLFRAQAIPDIFGVPDDWITWVPIQDDGSGRTPDRGRLDVREYDWSQPAWIFKALPASAATVPQQVPAWADDGGRLTARPSLDVRAYDWAPGFGWAPRIATASIVPFAPTFSSELASFRTATGPQLDVRTDWSPSQAWIFAQLPLVPDATVAQRAAIWPTALTFRTKERGGDVRTVDTQPAFTWVQPVVDASVAKFAGLVNAELASFRTPDDPRLEVRRFDWQPDETSWIVANLPPQLTIAQTWPAIWEGTGQNYRTPARPVLDLRGFDWAPAFTWVQPVIDASVARWTPAFNAELASYRTGDRARLELRTYAWAPDAAAWELINFAPPATTAQIWPAILENLGTHYQTPSRAKLDVRTYEWAPEFTWTARVIDATVAKWAPVFSTLIQSSPRTADRARLNVRTLTDRPVGHAWLSALQLVGVLPSPLSTAPSNETIYTTVVLNDVAYTTTTLNEVRYLTEEL